MKKITKAKKKGFTLIELIAVIAILAILAAIAIPNVIRYIDSAKQTAIQTEASTIYNAAAAAYNDGKLATTGTTSFDSVTITQVEAVDNGGLFVNKPKDLIPGTETMTQLVAIMNANKSSIQFNGNGQYTGIKSAS